MEISKKHPPFLHYLKEMSAKMADSLLMTASGALPEELFEYFIDGVHLFEIILLATTAHMIAWVVIGRDIKLHGRTVAQRDIGLHLLHKDSPDRQRHGGTLTHTHGIEVDIAILTAYPAATYQLRSKADKPSITVVIGGTRLGTNLSLQLITVAQSSCRTIIHYAHHHGWKVAMVLPSLSSMRLTNIGAVRIPWLAKAV